MSMFDGYKETDNRLTRKKRVEFEKGIKSHLIAKRLQACHNYQAFLDEQFSNHLTRKTQYSKARKILTEHFTQKRHQKVLQTYLKIFTLPDEVMQKIKQDYIQTVVQKNRLQTIVTHKEFMANVDKANQLMESKTASSLHLIIAIAILTGRRFFEVACRAKFSAHPDNDLMLLFEGQAKTRKNDLHKVFPIPCLVSSQNIINALQRLRTLKPETIEFTNEQFNNNFSRSINMAIKQYQFTGIKQPKDVRNLYLAYCLKYLKPVNISNNAYAAEILGHSDQDIQTANSYMTHVIIE